MNRFALLRVTAVISVLCGLAFVALNSLNAQTTPATVALRDACDPVTFNQAIGPGECIPGSHGTTKFNLYIAELTSDRIAGAWRFNPLLDTDGRDFNLLNLNLKLGQPTSLRNTGGELHTFTKVVTYGGGVVPILNKLSGNPTPAPECLHPENAANVFVEAGKTEVGPTAGTSQLPLGTTKWQCCVHPWMRLRVVVHPN